MTVGQGLSVKVFEGEGEEISLWSLSKKLEKTSVFADSESRSKFDVLVPTSWGPPACSA